MGKVEINPRWQPLTSSVSSPLTPYNAGCIGLAAAGDGLRSDASAISTSGVADMERGTGRARELLFAEPPVDFFAVCFNLFGSCVGCGVRLDIEGR